MTNTELLINRAVSMTAHAVKTQNKDCYRDSRKVCTICSVVRTGVSATSRLVTAEKLLAKWGF